MKRKGSLLFIFLILVVLCMSVIFYFSSQDNNSTNILSKNVTHKIAEIMFSDFKSMNKEIQNTITSQLNLFIRKMAHFSLYFIMSMTIYFVFVLWKKRFLISGMISVSFNFIYAILDEFHQSFVPGRTPLVKDVLIDTSGAILGTIFGFMIISSVMLIAEKIKSHE